MRERCQRVHSRGCGRQARAEGPHGGELALGPQNVRWRSEHTRREWLAGTVVDKMCALVDIDVINRQILAEQVLNCDD